MWNYVFGRFIYDMFKIFFKGMYFFFIGIAYIMWYSVYYGFIVIWYLVKYSSIIFCKMCVSICKCLGVILNKIKEIIKDVKSRKDLKC